VLACEAAIPRTGKILLGADKLHSRVQSEIFFTVENRGKQLNLNLVNQSAIFAMRCFKSNELFQFGYRQSFVLNL